jgi:uncharacterized protein YjdB
VTAKKIGETKIYASTIDGSDLTAYCTVIVIPQLIENLSLSNSEIEVVVDKSFQLTALISPSNASNKKLEWFTEDETIASVDDNGLVTALNIGETTIRGLSTDGSGLSASCKVIVTPQLIEQIELNETDITICRGSQQHLMAKIYPNNATNKTLIWSSTDSNIVSVSIDGIIEAQSNGEAKILAKTTDGSNIVASCYVEVIAPLATSIQLNLSDISSEVGSQIKLIPMILPFDASEQELLWQTSDINIASVSQQGLVSIMSQGNCDIIVSTTDGSELSARCCVSGYSGIESVIINKKNRCAIYTLSGILINSDATIEDYRLLSAGYYIIICDNVATRAYIK